jgi:methionine-gamma-lyase
VDNTFASPYLCRPVELGADLVVESATKYLAGHSDVLAGVVSGARDRIDAVREVQVDTGGTLAPLAAFLVLRGLATLAVRMERQCANAMALAQLLARHPKVEAVGYAGLPAHPDHERASSLFAHGLFGAMLSFSLRGGYDAAQRMTGSLRVARVGSSFGSMRTQICHPATTSHRQLSAPDRKAAGIDDGLLRLAVGGEDRDDLVEDFSQALDKA